MRPIPAPRLGDAHGLLRAIHERERLRLDEFVTEFAVEELFPPGLENALGRTRQFVSFARSAGLLDEDRGTVELTDMGKRYVRAGDASRPFDVSPAQAEWLRRLLRERHMTDSVYHGAAVALSLYAANPPDFRASRLDFGRAISHLGRAGWDTENTFQSQGERYTTFLCDLELIDADRRLTAIGRQTRDELTLPVHASLKDLAAQLNPGGLDAAVREGAADAATRPGSPAPEPLAAPADDDEYEDVGPAAAVSAAPTTDAAAAATVASPAPIAPPPGPADKDGGPAPIAPPPGPADKDGGAARVAPPPGPADDDRGAARGAPPDGAPAGDDRAAAPTAAPHRAPADDDLRAAPIARAPTFVPASVIRAAAEAEGLRLPGGVYAAVAAALATGSHLVLVGPPGAGKTTLALAVAKAAVQSGKADGATMVTAAHRWSERDTLGRPGDEEWEQGIVVHAAARGRWLVIDELDRARLDRALGALSSFLAGLPVTLPDGEAVAPAGWRIVATAGAAGLEGSPALLRRFAHVHVPPPADADLHAAIDAAAGGDSVASAAVRRLLGARELGRVGTGAFLAAARFAAARNEAAPADEATLAREALAAHVAPLLGPLDDETGRRLAALAG